jgi:hypothetical protein
MSTFKRIFRTLKNKYTEKKQLNNCGSDTNCIEQTKDLYKTINNKLENAYIPQRFINSLKKINTSPDTINIIINSFNSIADRDQLNKLLRSFASIDTDDTTVTSVTSVTESLISLTSQLLVVFLERLISYHHFSF